MCKAKAKAKVFWMNILLFANSIGEVMGHGNSGEFHNEKEFEKLVKDLGFRMDELKQSFMSMTGYEPILFNSKSKYNNYYHSLEHNPENWKFKNIRKQV